MTTPSAAIRATWLDPYIRGEEIVANTGYRLAIDVDAAAHPVQILTHGGRTLALVSPGFADLPSVRDTTNEESLRAALAAAGLVMNGADYLFLLSDETRAHLERSENDTRVRRLTADDAAAFAAFEQAAPADELDEAYVELDHWAVYGAFDGESIVAAGSAYPYGDAPLADLGVITLPSHRGRGIAREVIYALVRHALAEGYEPQYRCQLDNTSSVALATRSGFVEFATWDVPLPEQDDADAE